MDKDNTIFFDKIRPMRDEIDRIDSEILLLLARRQAQVEKVVALKKAHNMPVYHPAREEDLISRLRSQATQAGMNPDYLEDLYRVILRQSRIKQTRKMALKGLRPEAKVLVVGGAGQMGAMFVRLFSRSGYEVRVLDREDWDRAPEFCKDIDLALISVPIEKTCEVANAVAPLLPPDAVMADLTSVKQAPVADMCQAHKGPVIGLHPLFGPTTDSLDKQIVVTCDGRDSDACQWVVEQLNLWGAVIVPATAGEHDAVMEIVQALRHFATFCFGDFLCQRHAPLERTLEFSSPIYRLELGMVGRLFAQDPGLYAEIIFATPERRALLKEYIQSLSRHLDMLDRNDKSGFIDQFNRVAEWFGPFSEQAMRESTFIINKLIERF
ncbi:MAG TPA: bifunctional chorismate mutase/prephenate dehydrogenase [Desulfobacteraceae bacterium]|nr:bifunctional chorismate mutase/prephenate dehydrogenase [Desulfobacteraceae bacterium]